MTTVQRSSPHQDRLPIGPSHLGWVFLLLALLTAAALRFWHLGAAPPGLYRDEAYNGLDALGVLQGEHALFFSANNGREPAYIYLTALSVALLGRTALAIRLAAAIAGVLTTWITYHLATTWFNQRVGLLAAWLWAITLWPVHLSRIGLRAILLVPLLAAAAWLGALAYRRRQPRLWFLAGLLYGASFYTYLAVRLTPLLLLLFLLYLLLTSGKTVWRDKLWPGAGWFAAGAAIIAAPLVWLAVKDPALILGRIGQVSILDPAVNGGDLWGALWTHTWQGIGLCCWQGDTILRHNPAGRPVFDGFMLIPFALGLVWCLRRWRQPAAAALLLWWGVMSGPTILAEDTPHFLRAVGILPALLIFPAIGLAQLSQWSRLPRWGGALLVAALLAGSLALTVRDYVAYAQQPDTAYLFESGARDLAEQINADHDSQAIYIEDRFLENWPSVRFLLHPAQPVTVFSASHGLPPLTQGQATIFVWPHQSLAFVRQALPPPALVSAVTGSLGRGDLEPAAYPLFVRFQREPAPALPPLARFGEHVALHQAAIAPLDTHRLRVNLVWSTTAAIPESLVSFVHVRPKHASAADGLVGQNDQPPAQGHWPTPWWQPGLYVADQHLLTLREPYDPARHEILIGLYVADTVTRLPVFFPDGLPAGDSWLLK